MVKTRIKSLSGVCFVSVLIVVFTGVPLCAQDSKTCLEYAYPKGLVPSAEALFDKTYDALNVNGASLSCGPAIAASQARNALESFRYGVLYRDKAHIDAVLRYPLTVGVTATLDAAEKLKVVIIHNFQEWSALQDHEMTKIQIAAIACSWLGNVTVTAGLRTTPGFFIADGLVWFQRRPGSFKVWVTTLNLMPLTPKMLEDSCGP
jgi:hypothetical protein